MEIYFDGTLIDPNYYTQLNQSCLMFTDQENFKLGMTPCNSITLGIDKRYISDIPQNIIIKIGNVQYGSFKIDSFTENEYDYILKITDGMVNFNFNYDASEIIEKSNKTENGVSYVTLLEILQDICSKANISLKNTSFIGSNKHISWYDNTITAREYIGYIAELNGGYAFINNNGELELKQFNNIVVDSIPIDNCDSFKIGESHKITRVLYDNGLQKYEFGDETNNTLAINPDNVFITSQSDIENIFNVVNNLEFCSFSVENCPIGSAKIGECIEFTDGVNSYKTFAQYELRYFGEWIGGYKFKISSQKVESTTEIKGGNIETKIKRVKTTVDRINNEISLLSEQIIDVSETIRGVGQVQLVNAYEGILHYLSIKGNISLLFPSSQNGLYGYALAPSENLTPSSTLTPSSPVPKDNKILYPSNDLFSRSSNLIIDDVEYKLDFNFLNYINDTDCDEFIYEDGKCWIIRRVGIDENGNLYATGQEVIETRKDIVLNVKSNSTIKLKSFENAIYETQYLLENEYTDNFVTEVDVISRINLSPGTAVIEASKLAQITADKINLEGYTTINGGFTIDEYGNPTIKLTDEATDFGIDAKLDIIGTESQTQVNSFGVKTEWYNSRGYKNNCYLGTNNVSVQTEGLSYDTDAMLYSDEESATLSLQLYDKNGNPYNGLRINVFPEKKVRIQNQNGGELFMEHTLYENSSGSNGTISLSQSVSGFEYLEIYYTDNNKRQVDCIKVFDFQSKKAEIAMPYIYTIGSDVYFQYRNSGYVISESSISPEVNSMITTKNTTISSHNASSVNYVYITKVVGYK